MVIFGLVFDLFAERMNALFSGLTVCALSTRCLRASLRNRTYGPCADRLPRPFCLCQRETLRLPSSDNVRPLPAVDTLKDSLAMILSVLRGMMNRKAFPLCWQLHEIGNWVVNPSLTDQARSVYHGNQKRNMLFSFCRRADRPA